uniref:Uncharacterized protein n=1 Tax=Plectus sambesii TaxID=2011161 RepID=A0A914WGK2_9BILA
MHFPSASICVLLLLTASVDADWWSDVVDGAQTAWEKSSTWVQEEAAPAVSDMVSEHGPAVKEWWQESAKPKLGEWVKAAGAKADELLSDDDKKAENERRRRRRR